MYVSVMILFCTRSLKYSTDVPVGSAGLVPFISVDSECCDCASNSLGIIDAGLNIGATGVLANAGNPVAAKVGTVVEETLPPGVGPGEGFGLDLKDDSRFCADDLRRMVGRCGSDGAMAIDMDNPDPPKLAMVVIVIVPLNN
jgi:hypothetical protein